MQPTLGMLAEAVCGPIGCNVNVPSFCGTHMCVGGSQGHSHIQRFTRKTHGTQDIVVLTVQIYYSDVIRICIWTMVEKGTGRVWRDIMLCRLPYVPSPTRETECTPLQGTTAQHACGVSTQGSPLETWHSLGDTHVSTLCTCQNSRLLEGKQVFSIHHIVCPVRAEWTPLLVRGRWGPSWNPSSQAPAKDQAGFPKASSLRLFSHSISINSRSQILEWSNLTHLDSGVSEIHSFAGRLNGVIDGHWNLPSGMEGCSPEKRGTQKEQEGPTVVGIACLRSLEDFHPEGSVTLLQYAESQDFIEYFWSICYVPVSWARSMPPIFSILFWRRVCLCVIDLSPMLSDFLGI